jgi:hypothetical protein
VDANATRRRLRRTGHAGSRFTSTQIGHIVGDVYAVECRYCGEVIVREGEQWITLEGTLYCVLSKADAHHVPPGRTRQERVVDVREAADSRDPVSRSRP